MTQQTYALPISGVVAKVGECPSGLDPALLFGESGFVACPAATKPGWTFDGTIFSAPAPVPPTQADLVAYANAKQVALRDGGINVNIGTASTPDEINVASDVNGRSLVAGAVQLVGLAAQNGQPAPSFPWINNGGTQITLTAPQMTSIGLTLGTFVQATYATLGAILAAIAAGTITTTAEIDAPPASVAAWPATSY